MSEKDRQEPRQITRPPGAESNTTGDIARKQRRKRQQDEHLGVNRTSQAEQSRNPGDPH
jgi:hypothetical protein